MIFSSSWEQKFLANISCDHHKPSKFIFVLLHTAFEQSREILAHSGHLGAKEVFQIVGLENTILRHYIFMAFGGHFKAF